MKNWICEECGHEVLTMDDRKPEPIRWSDGHFCQFIKAPRDFDGEGGNDNEKEDH
jgi:hypothetical protein